MTPPRSSDAAYPRADVANLLRLSTNQRRILDAAAEAFAERGYDATSMDEIAERIGASKGTVYYSYRSKIDIFLAVYERGMLSLEQQVEEALRGLTDGPAADRLKAACVAHAENVMSDFTYHVVIQSGVEQRRQMALRDADRARLSDLDRMRTVHETLVQSLIEDGQHDGSLRPLPSRLATRTLLGGIVGIAIWYRPRVEQTPSERREIAEQVVAMLLHGLSP